MSGLDWAALAAEEVASAHADETRTESGIILGVYGGARLRSWVKFRGEPAQTFYETPAEFATRWLAFRDDPEQEVCIFHEHAFGQPVFLFREALEHLMYVQVTYPTTEQGRSTPGSIWVGQCPCARYGGPCPPLPASPVPAPDG